MTLYTAETLDLSRLAAPSLVSVDYLASKNRLIAEFKRLWEIARASNPALPPYDVELLETDPAVILTEEFAYGDALLRHAINDTANALRLATAVGADLDQIAVTYHRTQRKLLVPANPITGTPAVYESDAELRSRAQLAPEALADFGLTPGGYVYKVRTAFADRIKHVIPINRGAGLVELRVLGRSGDGTVAPALLGEISAAFAPEDASQSTDILAVMSAVVEPYDVDLTLVLPVGPDPSVVSVQARAAVLTLAAELHKLNAPLFREAFSSAAHVGPVLTVRVNEPLMDRPRRPEVAPLLRNLVITTEVA